MTADVVRHRLCSWLQTFFTRSQWRPIGKHSILWRSLMATDTKTLRLRVGRFLLAPRTTKTFGEDCC